MRCEGCDGCKGCTNVTNGLYCVNQKDKKNIIFRTEVSEERYEDVKEKINEVAPHKLEEYIKSLPEFNEEDWSILKR